MTLIKKLAVLCLFVMNTISVAAQMNIIPLPKSITENSDVFTLSPDAKIYYEPGLEAQADLLSAALAPATGFELKIIAAKTLQKGIVLKFDKTLAGSREGYKLNVNNDAIVLSASTAAGVFYGTQTLMQLFPKEIYSKKRLRNIDWKLKGVTIKDEPQYAWRGMMLDVSRYFFSKQYVLKFIDMMSMYKMNTLHLHLTDDAGWRLEIKKYPKLTAIGAWRGEGAERTGGYYTQEDIKEMVDYAAQRNVDIIPEIELPAHALASIAAYPYLCCTGEQYVVQTQHSISKDIYCVGKESTFDFLADIFKETFALFPSKYIHIGGDEANYERWKACPHCQKRKAELGLKSEKELQVYLNQRVQKMVAKYGKTIVGWDEIIEDGLKEKAVGMIWHDAQKTFKAVENGHDVVMSLTSHLYFDVAESNIPGEIKAAGWLSPISMEKVYRLNPMIDGLDEKYRTRVLGASAALWSDQFIHGILLQELPQLNENRSEKYFDYLTLPRMSALAEVCWTPLVNRNWAGFQQRMSSHYQRYDYAGYGYRVPQPELISNEQTAGGFVIKMKNPVEGAEIMYSIDGTRANAYSKVYTQPVSVKQLSDFSAITVVNRDQYSLPLYFPEKYDQFKKYGALVAEWKPEKIKAKDFTAFEFIASGKINGNGSYELAFCYTGGNSRLDIQSVEVYKNGIRIAADQHDGFTGGAQEGNIYKFDIKEYETGAAFTVKALVRGDISNDSYGAVFIKKL
ncbi:MAG TPA: family 20 glycosylhydrolase [Pedobacter sp.]|nr:family 20 glycosylhydrolase [Pedobacter sp.]